MDRTEKYYWQRFGDLDFDHKIHFTTRLYNFAGDARAGDELKILGREFAQAELDEILQGFYDKPFDEKSRFWEMRKSAFEKYPRIQFVDLALSRLMRLRDNFGVDKLDVLYEYMPKEEFVAILDELRTDDESFKRLSTLAVTVVCMGSRMLYGDTRLVDYERIWKIGEGYDLDNPVELSLLFYLYTHCPIYESGLYMKEIPDEHLEVFRKMLGRLDELVMARTGEISLDNKLELLVCCEMCGYAAKCRDMVMGECDRSMKGTDEEYLVDKENAFFGVTGTGLNESEHRNVLYVLSGKKYKPCAEVAV